MTTRIRCLLGMLGTDVHNKGIRTLARMLIDAGIEVIYIGEHNTCEGMVKSILEEDPDLVGVSFSSSSYMDYTGELLRVMHDNKLDDIPLMIGGLIHQEDHPALEEMGVSRIFGPGSRSPEIIAWVRQLASSETNQISQQVEK